ncbi:AAA family ATPase [Gammaproteobacteria bacterium]
MYKRPVYQILQQKLLEKRLFLQIISGPRQVGKTTLVQQVLNELSCVYHYATADEPGLLDHTWIEAQWHIARKKINNENKKPVILALDEVQKIPEWSTIVKKLWDEDTRSKTSLQVVLLGSSSLLMQKGLEESMAGRFEIINLPHWFFSEMRDAFGWALDKYIYFGGYPGAAAIVNDEPRWAKYVTDSLIEPTITRDILLLNPIYKPVLLRQLFQLGCHYSGQILSLQKMLGQLHDAGNTTTLSHYLELLYGAGMLTGLQKYSGPVVKQKASSPKLQVLNNALMNSQSDINFALARQNHEYWGRLVESAIGAHLVNSAFGSKKIQVFYWRSGNFEVDFVIKKGAKIIALEVKSTRREVSLPGMAEFKKVYKNATPLLVGGSSGVALEEFLSKPLSEWL